MQYMLLIYSADQSGPQPGTPEFGPYMGQYQSFTKALQDGGAFVAGDALQPSTTATTVTLEKGSVETTDGPFAETKEQLGGYYLIECDSLDKAIEYAAMIPTATHGRIEVRPVMTFD